MKDIEIGERIQQFLKHRLEEKETINAMMQMELASYDIEERFVVLHFPVDVWQLNPAGTMHGGMICTALDIAMGCASYIFSDAVFTPTIQMAVNFDCAIQRDTTLAIKGICDHVGHRMAQVRAIAYELESEKVVASANGSYAINK